LVSPGCATGTEGPNEPGLMPYFPLVYHTIPSCIASFSSRGASEKLIYFMSYGENVHTQLFPLYRIYIEKC
jgi:hypothetical protein